MAPGLVSDSLILFPTSFALTNSATDSARWNFGDVASGAANISNQLNPTHVFSSADTFTVTLVAWDNGLSDTSVQQVVINPLPPVNLGVDTTLCNGQSLMLDPNVLNASYLWQNNSQNATQTISQSGNYWVEVTAGACKKRDSITVTFVSAPVINLGNDTTLCSGQTLLLDATIANGVYQWQNSSSAPTQVVSQSGTYSVNVSNGTCSSSDTIRVDFTSGFAINLGTDTSLCSPQTLLLDATTQGALYQWQDNSSSPVYNVTRSGYYSVIVSVAGCVAKDTIHVSVDSLPAVIISSSNNIICASDSTQVCAPSGFSDYHWNVGLNTSCIYTSLAGNYYVTVTDNNGCTAESNHLGLVVFPPTPVSISINGDTLRVYNAIILQWYRNGTAIIGATDSVYIARQGGSYTVAITDSNGCVATSSPIIITGIESFGEEEDVNIYPNPSPDGSWQLVVANSLIGGVVEVFDANGRVLFQSIIVHRQSEIVPDIARGVYFLRVSNGKSSFLRKLVRL